MVDQTIRILLKQMEVKKQENRVAQAQARLKKQHEFNPRLPITEGQNATKTISF